MFVTPHLKAQDLVFAAAVEDPVEDPRQEQGVDDVPLETYVLVCRHARDYTAPVDASGAAESRAQPPRLRASHRSCAIVVDDR